MVENSMAILNRQYLAGADGRSETLPLGAIHFLSCRRNVCIEEPVMPAILPTLLTLAIFAWSVFIVLGQLGG